MLLSRKRFTVILLTSEYTVSAFPAVFEIR